MKVLLTGASGFVASDLLQRLGNQSWSGWAVARRTIKCLPLGWEWVERSNALDSSLSADWLVHLEVKHHVPSPRARDVAEFESVNVRGTRQWLDWASQNGIRKCVHFSTIKAVRTSAGEVADEHATGPGGTAYGASKWRAEEVVRAWAANDRQRTAIIVQPAVVYGPGGHGNLYAMVQSIAKGRFLFIGSAANPKSVVSLKNVGAAVLHLMENCGSGLHIFNITDEHTYSVRELGQMMAQALGTSLPRWRVPVFAAQLAASAGDLFGAIWGRDFPLTSPRLEALLEHTNFSCKRLLDTGFRHLQSTEEGIQELIDWHRQTHS
ncbi:MAG: NAD-dependent epimerase/dehydratase family protein [Verrucomicrobiia bacterium]